VPWSFRIWKGQGHPTPCQLAGKLLSTVPALLTLGRQVLVQADTEFGSKTFIASVRKRSWQLVVGMPSNRTLTDGRSLKELYLSYSSRRGQLVHLKDIDEPLTVSWFWLKRADNKRELRFVVSTHPYSGAYLVLLGRKRWAIEGFFKTIKHRFGLDHFGQSTKLGVYRWLLLALIAYLLTHWIHCWSQAPVLDWQAAAKLTLSTLFPLFLFRKLLKAIDHHQESTNSFGFEIILQRIPDWQYP
jgi:Transposase DDE domain